jgi:hypothetical protein
MSHFLDIRTQLNHPQALLNGLTAMGFNVQAAIIKPETQQTAAAIAYHNSFGDSRHAHVIARHRSLLNGRTAIGFLWDALASIYTLQCDPYEIRRSQYGREFSYSGLQDYAVQVLLTQRIQMEHDRAAILLKFPADKYVIAEERIENKLTLTVKPKPQLQALSSSIGSTI